MHFSGLAQLHKYTSHLLCLKPKTTQPLSVQDVEALFAASHHLKSKSLASKDASVFQYTTISLAILTGFSRCKVQFFSPVSWPPFAYASSDAEQLKSAHLCVFSPKVHWTQSLLHKSGTFRKSFDVRQNTSKISDSHLIRSLISEHVKRVISLFLRNHKICFHGKVSI